MRHLAAFCSLLAALGATGVALDRLAAMSLAPGVVIAWSMEPDRMLAALDARTDLRVVNVWAGGRLVQLHAESTRHVAGPLSASVLTLRLPAVAVHLAACG